MSNAETSDDEKLKVLRNVELFKDIDYAELSKIANAVVEVKYKANQTVAHKGTVGNKFFIVKNGNVLVTDITIGESTYSDTTFGPGAFFGEAAIMSGIPYPANARAAVDTTLYYLEKDDFCVMCTVVIEESSFFKEATKPFMLD